MWSCGNLSLSLLSLWPNGLWGHLLDLIHNSVWGICLPRVFSNMAFHII